MVGICRARQFQWYQLDSPLEPARLNRQGISAIQIEFVKKGIDRQSREC
jgi:hypothetical protein